MALKNPNRSAYRSKLLKTTKAMKVTVTLGALPGVESNESQERVPNALPPNPIAMLVTLARGPVGTSRHELRNQL
jgi:hypothetical protein